jgi:hypothetical protein
MRNYVLYGSHRTAASESSREAIAMEYIMIIGMTRE